jgi:hypothetical protein
MYVIIREIVGGRFEKRLASDGKQARGGEEPWGIVGK